jgi:class I fructose-bisphosphate aldolase
MAKVKSTEGIDSITKLLGNEADYLLDHKCKTVPKSQLHLPGPDFVDRIFIPSDRPNSVLRNLQLMYNTGRLAGTGYMSILPVDQGIEHSAGASFAPNPIYFDPGSVSRKYAHKIPFLVKLNHNELLTYPNKFDQIMFANVDQAYQMGAVAVGATIYFGSEESDRQIQEVSEAFSYAHTLGLVTVLWAYLRNAAFKTEKVDYDLSADLTGQANHISATIEADIVKQKQAENNGGFLALKFGKTDPRVYSKLTTEHPVDLTRYQVVNCYMGRASLINSGGASTGSDQDDLAQAVRTAVINKRAGGMGLITGRKSFQKSMKEGVEILNAVQNVYLCEEVSIA